MPTDPEIGEVAAYCGRGTRGWRLASAERRQDVVIIEAGEVFGGEWPERQVWHVIDGEGSLSCDATAPRVHVGPGDGYRFAAGERRLIVAETRMRLLITPLDGAEALKSLPEA